MNHENDPFEDFRRKRELREEARTRDQQTRLAQQIFADENRAEYVDRHIHDEMQDFFDESSRKAAQFVRGIQSDHEAEQGQRIQNEAEDFLSMSRQQTESVLSNLSEEELGALSGDPSESGASFPRIDPDRQDGCPFPRIDPAPEPEASETNPSSRNAVGSSLADVIRHQEMIGPLVEESSAPSRFGLPRFDVGLDEDRDDETTPGATVSSAELEALRNENRELSDIVESLQKRLEILTSVLIEKQAISWDDLESEVIPL